MMSPLLGVMTACFPATVKQELVPRVGNVIYFNSVAPYISSDLGQYIALVSLQ